jgi:hypothetical protein
MKIITYKIILILLFFRVISLPSQSLQLTDQQGLPIVPDATIVQSGSPDHGTFFTYLNVTNTSAAGLAVKCKKTEIRMLDSTTVFMCWAGVCYSAAVFTSSNSQPIGPGETYYDYKGTYHQVAYNNYIPGESVVRWTFFDESNPDDSVSVTVIYATWPVGTPERNGQEATLTVFPNPAGDQITVGTRGWNDGPVEVQIHDMTGIKVSSVHAEIFAGSIELSTRQLKNGVYICTVKSRQQSGQVRLVVSN